MQKIIQYSTILFFWCNYSVVAMADNDHPEWSVSLLSSNLTNSANSVIREHNEVLTISNDHDATAETSRTLTLLNDKAKHLSHIALYYDKLSQVQNISASIYDATGKHLRTLKSKDWLDMPYSDMSLITDGRLITFDLVHSTYPYTIHYSYTRKYDGYMKFTFYPFLDEYQNIEKSNYTIHCSNKNNLNYFCGNFEQSAQKSDQRNNSIWEWNFDNAHYTEVEVLSGNFLDNTPYIKVIPQKFSLDGYDGSNETWASFGTWCYSLWKGRDKLPKEAIIDIAAQIKPNMSLEQKVAAIYRYVQNRNRYVSIQLGIGGWRPFNAEYVHKNRYGDCKALTNYTMAALKSVDIDSHPALIDSEEGMPLEDFKYPHNQFNHVILCIPNPTTKDTIWLECTADKLKAGQLSSTCSNKPVLLIGDLGGKVAKTPTIQYQNQQLLMSGNMQLDSLGNINGTLALNGIGLQQNCFYYPISNSNPKDVTVWLQKTLKCSNATVTQSNFANLQYHTDTMNAQLQLQIKANRNMGGKRLFFSPAIVSVGDIYNLPAIAKDTKRQKDVYLYDAFSNEMDISIKIPKGWKVESLPDAVTLQQSFGTYSSQYRYDEQQNAVILHSTMAMKEPIIKAAQYEQLRNFYEQIRKNRQQMVVLVKQ